VRLVILRTALLLFLIPEALLTLSASAVRTHDHAHGSELNGWAATWLAVNPDVWVFGALTYLLWGPLRNGVAAAAHVREAALRRTWMDSLWPPTAKEVGHAAAAVALWRVASLAIVCWVLPTGDDGVDGGLGARAAGGGVSSAAFLLHPIVSIRDTCQPTRGPPFPVVSASPAHSMLVAGVDAAVVVVLCAIAHQLRAISAQSPRHGESAG